MTWDAGAGSAGYGSGGGAAWMAQVVGAVGDGEARQWAAALAEAAPAGYRERVSPPEAACDAIELSLLASDARGDPSTPGASGRHRTVVRPGSGDRFRLRRFADRPIELTDLLPVLESFGLVVEQSVPYRIDVESLRPACIDDIAVHLPGHRPETPPFDPAGDGGRLVDALDAVEDGVADVDRLNSLVVAATLTWRQAALLRAYSHFWAQCAATVTSGDVEASLLGFPSVARALVEYFAARFDPGSRTDEAAARSACLRAFGRVPHLQHDRALRVVLQLIDATQRTNYFQPAGNAGGGPAIALKLGSGALAGLSGPAPAVETWVHHPAVEGVHLRAGPIARGGIRWSERQGDFRSEVLGLMVAQVKKNAIIVPTGAKGGFVCRASGIPTPEAVRDAYATFVGALLDVTDNLVDGQVVGPPGVRPHDGDDPYLVVAADRGTADLSDLANEISASRRFWLGDAFASGGSHGYNHKAMGITARGAWVAVRRHFHQLGIDVQREAISVAGVGDMSGDVFGNGMLCSEAIRLVAAFDHRHVFVDPDPDPARSYVERRRLAGLPRSSWADYDPGALSPGGGVWSRDDKMVPLDASARRALRVDAEQLTPPELVAAILEAPVDLLWFGGIGTFVRAEEESDAEVADRANDEVRVTAARVRARVVAEGGNLAMTQRARIRYSRRGGRINTDFIDNAAGVATSDREVNLKILLAVAIGEGRLDTADRDATLAKAEPEVAAAVLRAVDHNVSALNRAIPDSAAQLDAYAALLDTLEKRGALDRIAEALPDAHELAVRRSAGAGLIRPELAVLLAYAKSDLVRAVEGSAAVSDPAFGDAVRAYFPAVLLADVDELVGKHRLYDRILATEVAAEVVDQLGIVWAHETAAELGRPLADAAASFWAAREVVGAPEVWRELDAVWSELPADAETGLRRAVADAVGALARRYLRQGPVAAGDLVAADRPLADALAREALPALALPAVALPALAMDDLSDDAGVGLHEIADACAVVLARAKLAEVGPVVRATGRRPEEIMAALGVVDQAVDAGRIVSALRTVPLAGRWPIWLGRALLDDLADWRHETVTATLGSSERGAGSTGGFGGGGDGDPAEQMAAWAARHASELADCRRLLGAVDGAGPDALTVVALVLRRLPSPWSGAVPWPGARRPERGVVERCAGR